MTSRIRCFTCGAESYAGNPTRLHCYSRYRRLYVEYLLVRALLFEAVSILDNDGACPQYVAAAHRVLDRQYLAYPPSE